MDLTALEPTGPYRLIVDGATNRHIEYFENSHAALNRWAEFDAVMRPTPAAEQGILDLGTDFVIH